MSDFLRDLAAKISLQIDDNGLEAFNKKLEGMHRSLEIVAGAEILKGLFEIAEKFSGMGEQLETAAASAGITTEAFQQLAFAASQSGVGSEKLGFSLTMLSRQLEGAREGSEGALATFEKIGISPEQVASFHDSSDALKAVADRIAAIQDPIKRTQTAMKLFGRGGAQMVRFLGEGSEGIDKKMAQASKIGAVVSAKQIEQLAELEDALSAFGTVVKAAFATIATYAAPIIRAFVTRLEEFWVANRAIIQLNIKKWFGDLAFALGFVLGFMRGLIERFQEFTSAFPNLTKWFTRAAAAAVILSAGVSGILLVLRPITSAFTALGGVLSGVTGGLGAVVKGGRTLVTVLLWAQKAVAALVLRLAVLAARALPALGDALASVAALIEATPLGIIVAGLAAVVLASQTLWTLWRGGDFWKDTWLGQALGALGGFLNSGYKAATGKNLLESHMTDEEKAQRAQASDAAEAGPRNKFGQLLDPSRLSSPPMVPNLVNLAGAGNPTYDTSKQSAQVSFENTFNIQAPVGGDINVLTQTIKAAFDQSHREMLQQTQDVVVKKRVM